ncbi:MAG: UDP-N-acetylglucosamine--N-acetylmuramyl-(pentapeptide) pyrophosphoryl-undecaprenol N-acetylglucosamine transferase [Thermoflexales bacterium]|nr:UDP-N-acetylglucosamine--N-acetylmuramyl-(pentapeptide) pyrophosphoryl-undecaprenol N-acetylglucosamine transferase [Thermoflexales bacterium]
MERLWICGGGTGGHVYPALAVANELDRKSQIANRESEPQASSFELLYVGSVGGMETELVARAGLNMAEIPAGGIHGLSPLIAIRNGLKLAGGVWAALRLERPSAAFVTGGYVSVPAALACWLRRVPILLYLPDIEPGRAVKFISWLATRIGVTVEASRRFLPARKVLCVGYPLRAELLEAAAQPKQQALTHFELEGQPKTLLVFGGSRGARSLNRAIGAILEPVLERWQLLHISGTLDADEVAARRQALPPALQARYRLYPYLHEDMGLAMRAADLVVSRAGASILGEFPLFGLPAVLVPYPFAWRYQKTNADYLVEGGAAVRLDDEKLGAELLPTLEQLLGDEARLVSMQNRLHAMARTDAAAALARELLRLARKAQ